MARQTLTLIIVAFLWTITNRTLNCCVLSILVLSESENEGHLTLLQMQIHTLMRKNDTEYSLKTKP